MIASSHFLIFADSILFLTPPHHKSEWIKKFEAITKKNVKKNNPLVSWKQR